MCRVKRVQDGIDEVVFEQVVGEYLPAVHPGGFAVFLVDEPFQFLDVFAMDLQHLVEAVDCELLLVAIVFFFLVRLVYVVLDSVVLEHVLVCLELGPEGGVRDDCRRDGDERVHDAEGLADKARFLIEREQAPWPREKSRGRKRESDDDSRDEEQDARLHNFVEKGVFIASFFHLAHKIE